MEVCRKRLRPLRPLLSPIGAVVLPISAHKIHRNAAFMAFALFSVLRLSTLMFADAQNTLYKPRADNRSAR